MKSCMFEFSAGQFAPNLRKGGSNLSQERCDFCGISLAETVQVRRGPAGYGLCYLLKRFDLILIVQNRFATPVA